MDFETWLDAVNAEIRKYTDGDLDLSDFCDGEGEMRVIFGSGSTPDDVIADIRHGYDDFDASVRQWHWDVAADNAAEDWWE